MHPSPAPRPRGLRTVGRRLAVVAAVVVAATSLVSCRADQVGTAAVVDGKAISVEELQDATVSFLEAAPEGNSGDVQQAILQQMIVSAVIAKAADSAGVTVSAGEVAAARDQALESVREPAEATKVSSRDYLSRQLSESQSGAIVPPDHLEQFIRDQILASKLGAEDPAAVNEALVAAAEETDVVVNPRYGRWDPQQGLAPLISGGLSHTVDELSGGASQAP